MRKMEARPGIEPRYAALQAAASPLCHLAISRKRRRAEKQKPRPRRPRFRRSGMERETRFELATPTLARLCSTTELFPPEKCSLLYASVFACQGTARAFLNFYPFITFLARASSPPRSGRGQAAAGILGKKAKKLGFPPARAAVQNILHYYFSSFPRTRTAVRDNLAAPTVVIPANAGIHAWVGSDPWTLRLRGG